MDNRKRWSTNRDRLGDKPNSSVEESANRRNQKPAIPVKRTAVYRRQKPNSPVKRNASHRSQKPAIPVEWTAVYRRQKSPKENGDMIKLHLIIFFVKDVGERTKKRERSWKNCLASLVHVFSNYGWIITKNDFDAIYYEKIHPTVLILFC